MAQTNNSTMQQFHQKSTVDKNQTSVTSEIKRGTREGIRGASAQSLLSALDRLVDEVNEKSGRILSVAYGGEAYSGSPDSNGDPICPTCQGIFSTIIGMSENARPYYDLKDAIAELSYLVNTTPVIGIEAGKTQGGRA